MLKIIIEFGQSLGLIKIHPGNNTRTYKGSDYLLKTDQDKELIHLDYLYKLDQDENNRLTLIESKTSQLISQTGIIFSLLSLFVPLLIDKVADVAIITKITLLLLLLLAFIGYILTINNALKNFKVNEFNYTKPSPKNVITFQNKPTSEFYNEVIQDLIGGLNTNSEINNKKATNLLHSYKSFKLANLIMGVLVAFFCLTIFFFKPKESKVTISGTVKVEHLDSVLTKISNKIKIQNELIRNATKKDTFKASSVIKKNQDLKNTTVSLNSKVK